MPKFVLSSLIVIAFILFSGCASEPASSTETAAAQTQKAVEKEFVPKNESEVASMTKEEKRAYLIEKRNAALPAEKREKLARIRAEQNNMQAAAREESAAASASNEAKKAAGDLAAEDATLVTEQSSFARDLRSFVDAGVMDKRRRFIMDQVSFDQKGNLNNTSRAQLNELKSIMDRYPRLNVGFLCYSSQKLVASAVVKETERRGKMIADLLMNKGVAGNRLGFQGMGKPKAGSELQPERIEVVVMGL